MAVASEMFSAWDRRDQPPEAEPASGLQGFSIDKTFLSSFKGILLETELVKPLYLHFSNCLLAPPPLPAFALPKAFSRGVCGSYIAAGVEQDSFVGSRGIGIEDMRTCLPGSLRDPLLGMAKKSCS